MGHPFEIAQDAVVDATPEQVWEAIATGPGLNSWFLGRNEIEPREGGTVRFDIGDFTETTTVTTWDPPTRLVTKGTPGPDGAYHQFDYRVDQREGGQTAMRYVHSGMLGDDWEAEYEGMSEGDPMYFQKLVEYVTYFSGRFGKPVDAIGPNVAGDKEHAMDIFRRGLGLSDDVTDGDHVRLTPEGLPPIDGVVDHVSPSFLGVRTDDALYRFIRGYEGTVMVGHHLFADGVDEQAAAAGWRAWITRLFGR
ncbi:MAG: SRPBCC family protein [Actinomycetota bacterium]